MTQRKAERPPEPSDLRQRAEQKLSTSPADVSVMPAEDVQGLVHELQVHQVELEIQNEELRQAQQELAEARDRYLDLYQAAPVGYLTLDVQRTIRQANQAAAGMLGTEGREIVGKRLEELVVAEDADACYLHLRQVADEGKPRRCELRFRRSDGSWLWMRLDTGLAQPSETADSAPEFRIVMTDVTERNRAERALRNRSKQLRMLASELTLAEQRERVRLARVLHDGLQQLLVGARFRLVALERTGDAAVRRVAADLGELLADSIAMSRSLTAELSPPILHEAGLVPALEWLVRWMWDTHELSVDLDVPVPVGAIAEDISVLLFQATRELLFNVVKHAGVKSALVRVTREDACLRIVVADAGCGFDPSGLRAEGGPSGGFGLFGIGERLGFMGGRMDVDSPPGRGSRFTLTAPLGAPAELPLPDEHPARVSVAIAPPFESTAEGRIHVLLVDDHIVVRQGLAMLLRGAPDMAVVGEASDGESAVRLVRQVRPDVVLMDVSMPGMNGVDATRVIHGECPEVHVIGLSMFEEGQRAEAMRQAGAVAYLTKSGPAEALLTAIRACAKPGNAVAASRDGGAN